MAEQLPVSGAGELGSAIGVDDKGRLLLLRARHSHIDEFKSAGNAPPVIVKTITECSSPEHAARVAGEEFAALTWLRARMDALVGRINTAEVHRLEKGGRALRRA